MQDDGNRSQDSGIALQNDGNYLQDNGPHSQEGGNCSQDSAGILQKDGIRLESVNCTSIFVKLLCLLIRISEMIIFEE
ncbi:MAG: hypothetical protein A2W90_12245 [Bacteroidetes bacterium GWF2_42_66]|nr:MAG: hypothetical protein A2W92_23180 [Bacteroidetes bacterium GWA2_42_15]OFX99957.1 MAG: hypothetical protein A2W89_17230 [Bacteroidetes bacterium GWE2_42_39]OFY40142.1 MAG: hypothetical protein A2W90_12245 [Bacteroidetes bacterium GWF2_42_66]HBL73970.1 hypothetical protein [Prolixibacteraceae bacterium]HCR89219.1 hypothetical protein [Prolixibacteraceae bacterium]